MKTEHKKGILIVSYTFPPNPGIGGRRWAKFVKKIYKKGHDIKVFAADLNGVQNSSWNEDVKNYKKSISYVKSNYPIHLTQNPKSIFDKIAYRLELLWVKLYANGNYYDRSIFWGDNICKKIETELLTETFTHIICTGAPFDYLSKVIGLKSKFPNVKFVADLRDPWTCNETSYGWAGLSDKRKKK